MRHAVSNIALTPFDHDRALEELSSLGLEGIEVAPSRIWRDTWEGLTPQAIERYRRQIEGAGLSVVGLHSLFFDQPDLGLFSDDQTRERTHDFLVHLSLLCRDLGGRTLIWGGGRKRGRVPPDESRTIALNFLESLCPKIEPHGTCLCFEPLGPGDSDFINSALEALDLVNAIDSPAFAVQLDAKALVENDEAALGTFEAVAGRLVHFHANEPGLGVLGSTGAVDHHVFGSHLSKIGYDGWVSIEQRMLGDRDPLADIADSTALLRKAYP